MRTPSVSSAWRGPRVVLAGALALTLSASWVLSRSERATDEAQLEAEATRAVQHVMARMLAYEALLRGVAGFVAADVHASVARFRRYVSELDVERTYPGTLGLGFTRRIPAHELDVEVARVRQSGHPGFEVWPPGPRPEYHSIVLLEPQNSRNQVAIGYDMFTEPVRHEAMARARDTGHMVAAGGVTLVQEIDQAKQPGFLLYLPVYASEVDPSTVGARRRDLIGFAYAPLRAHDLLAGIFQGVEALPRMTIYDGPTAKPESLLYESGPGASAGPVVEKHLEVGDRVWTARFALVAPSHGPRASTMLALLGSVLSLLLFRVTSSRERARIREVEEHRRAEAERELRLADLQRSLALSEWFVGILGHDLRNPLNAISTGLQVMLARATSDAERDRLARMVASARRMGRMIDEMLDLTRARLGGGIPVRPAPTDAAEIAESVVGEARAGGRRDIQLRRHGDPHGTWDRDRLAQALSNLVGNAVQHGAPSAPVLVEVAGEAPERVTIQVHNEGAIEAELLPHVFEPFRGKRREGSSSLGLGLYITHQIVRAHGGGIEVESAPAAGTTFRITLPRRAPDADRALS